MYLFSGRRRRTSVASYIHHWSNHGGEFDVEVEEWDITNGKQYDLLNEQVQQQLLARIANHDLAVLMSPPCGTWSRAPWANQFGPRPLRPSQSPWGFAWLEGSRLRKVGQSNTMMRFCIQVLCQLQLQDFATSFLLETLKIWAQWQLIEFGLDIGGPAEWNRQFDQLQFGSWLRYVALCNTTRFSHGLFINALWGLPHRSLQGFCLHYLD